MASSHSRQGANDWFFLVDPGPGMAQQVLAERVERLLAQRKGALTLHVPRPLPN